MDNALPAGWYPDAADATSLRFWTGDAWSAHRKPRPGVATGSRLEHRRTATMRRHR